MGRCLSPSSRARLISLGTIAPGVAGIGAGAVVGLILSSPVIAWPLNYALLFMCTGVLYTFSLVSFFFVRDPPASVHPKMPWPAYFGRMVTVVKGDPAFRKAVIAAVALGGIGIAAPFYIVHGLESLGFPRRAWVFSRRSRWSGACSPHSSWGCSGRGAAPAPSCASGDGRPLRRRALHWRRRSCHG